MLDSASVHKLSHSSQWLDYFRYNRDSLSEIPWDDPYQLTGDEKMTIAHSIRNFQLGESSEGVHLMKLARGYATHTNDPAWVIVMKLFIGEEQRHARDLGRFMRQQDIALAQKHWSDSWFRKARRLANLEVALAVLLTAEAVATIYYAALGSATQSYLLRALCQQIVQDEVQHVSFQAATLGLMRTNYATWQLLIVDATYWIFFRMTLLVVWCDHHPVLRAGGYSFTTFYQACCQVIQQAYQRMQE
jgi:hypothetical protein